MKNNEKDINLMSCSVASKVLGISPPTLRSLSRKGHIGYYTVGKYRRYKIDDLVNYLERNKVEALQHKV